MAAATSHWIACDLLPQPYTDSCTTAFNTASAFDSWLSSTSTGYFIRLYGAFYTICIVATLWVFYVARKLSPGLPRILACLPVVVLQLSVTPLLVDRTKTPVLVVPVMGIFSLAAFKVAAFALGRGPLALPNCPWLDELPRFGAVLSFPVIPRAVFKISEGSSADALSTSAPTTPGTFAYTYCCKAGGAAVAATLAVTHVLPQLVRHWFYALCLSLSLGAIWDFWCLMVVMWFGVDVAPSFDKPWLSTSFADYWSRRWNLTTTYMLRVLIYEPIMEGRLVPATQAAKTNSASTAHTPSTDNRQTNEAVEPAAGGAVAAAPAGPEDEHSSDTESVSSSRPAAVDKETSDMPTTTAATAKPMHFIASSATADVAPVKDNVCLPAGADSDSKAVVASVHARAAKKNRLLRRGAALHATFAFSGLWHMLIFYYATGLVTYHWFVFFSVQAPIMTAEAILIKWATSRGINLRKPVAIFLTNFLLIVVANPLFFGPCDWSGMCTAMMDNVKASFTVSS